MDLRHHRFYLFVVLCATASGCAGRWPFSNSASTENQPSHQYRMGGTALGQPRPPQNEGGIFGTFKTVSNRVSDALTIKPRVIPAKDPIRLSNKPKSIDPQLFIMSARVLENQKNFVAAEQQYRKALKIDANNHAALVGIGRLFDRRGSFGQAEVYYRQAITQHPNQAGSYNDLGLCLARKGNVKASIHVFQQAVRLNSGKVLYRNNLAAVLVEDGRSQEALRNLMAVYKPAIAHYNVGFLLYKRSENAAASRHFQLAVQSDPQFYRARRMIEKIAGTAPIYPSPSFQVGQHAETNSAGNSRVTDVYDQGVIRLPSADFKPVSVSAPDAPTPTNFDSDFPYGEISQRAPQIQ
ncbi:MAG: tetratricopeptide repeat protein [Planctomycetes bacterium]|nr:tetratricopeptide repeat protein [Planctomycetota bacterium]